MTAIAIWPSYENPRYPRIWASGDSLISRTNGSPLIQDGAKIFSIPIACRTLGEDGLFSEPYFAHTLGYCFAGSTLMGQNSFLSAAPLLMTLTSEDRYAPSIKDIADYFIHFMNSSYDYYKLIAREGAQFEAAIFGWCPNVSALEAWHFKPCNASGEWRIIVDKVCLDERNRFLYLGDCRSVAEPRLKEALESGTDGELAPRKVIQDLIRSENCATIGGDEQLAMANKYGLQPYQLARSTEPGGPPAIFTHLGIELTDEIARVGNANVGGPIMYS